MRLVRHLLLLILSLVIVSRVDASLILIESDNAGSTEGYGTFTGSLDYTFSSATMAQLVLSLTNTSLPANGGRITAVAFNNPGGITGVTLSTATNLTTLLGGPTFSNSVPAPPFGNFDIGASLNGSWLGGGSPNGGIPVGGTGVFTFMFSGTGLDQLTTSSFVNELSSDNEFLVVRYRGFENGASDKVPAQVVPEVSSVVMMGMVGSASLAVLIRRRMKKPTR